MRKAKKVLSIVMVLCLSVLLLAGCTGGGKTNEGTAATNGESKEAEKSKTVNLIWYLRGDPPKNSESVYAKANEIVTREINATVDFRVITGGEYNDKMQMIMASAETYDICYTASWANNYLSNVAKGAFLPLDDILKNYPRLVGQMPQSIWNAIKVNGKIYAIPNYQVMYQQYGIWMLKDYVEKYKIDISKIHNLNDITPILQTIKDNESGLVPLFKGHIGLAYYHLGALQVIDNWLYVVDTNTWKVHEGLDDYMEFFKIMRDWYNKGFFPEDVATMKDETTLVKAGKVFSKYTRVKPGNDADLKLSMGIDTITVEGEDMVILKDSVLSTLNGISTTSQNPDRAVALIDLMFADKELYNTMVFGIENQDYKKVSENRIEPLEGGYSFYAWMLGNQFNAYILPGQIDTIWEETQKNNEAARAEELITFFFNREPVETQLAQISSIVQEYEPILVSGLDDPDKVVAGMREKLKAAGIDDVIAEMQKQIDAWRTSK